ncbi:dicarboxylate/amino acid:cation symporter [Mesobacillus selenatarsenatis]|uniref:Proton/sodium-glutamate symport protein n=1 Tax=Mesobacillus selenatarsenatis (strain DSM 18680 / JCM 14380 / FERM P-15431 / SF-1) TaxID=1321606 RepID=A0A0A8XBJ5_MESS1|nr:dicarboxylate/amino acid:cation symporter [Mesobacillus selenatarsenatis]GAM15536.1 proton/sodium-glutamate symport protein [Mesobacillus selenatarsenatis SF-1]
MNIWNSYKNSSFILKMTVGFVLGILAGVLFGAEAEIFKPFGTLLIKLLNLIATPVVFLTVVLAVNQMNPAQLGRTGGKLVLYYGATTAAAVLIGLGLALWINPGSSLSLPSAKVEKPATPSFSDVIFNIVPDNFFSAFTSGNLMAILFLAVIIGFTISGMRFANEEKVQNYGTHLQAFFEAANEVFFRILKGILLYAPIGIFAISASTFGTQGWDTLTSLLEFTAVFYIGVIILWTFVYSGTLKLFKIPVKSFFANTKDAYTTAFFTSSSIASLPVAIESAKKAGISERMVNFSLPLGAVFNSDGGALRMGASIVFAANVTGISFSLTDFITIVLIGTLLSIGTAGIPAAGLVTLSVVLTMFDLPLEVVALIAGVDAIIGMAGTASNVVGDVVGAAVVDQSEKKAEMAG